MRPLRFLLSLATCIIAFTLLLLTGPWRGTTEEAIEEHQTIGAYFNWRTPSSLFPPSAIISLTDDNSTFFLARPAAFGPLLPSKSLSGQLWVGSGFGDDYLRGGAGAGAEGELGCSDIPDWNNGDYRTSTGSGKLGAAGSSGNKANAKQGKEGKSKRSSKLTPDAETAVDVDGPEHDDGTDDHLHHPLPPSDDLKTNGPPHGKSTKQTHADIQSMQEGAEIAGKIVLLSRGGCGFLEKVKWVQRRGGVALIVGDDIRGGPLVTMYARGDTSNVTIPSLFTSHTTAHLLSSLIPSGGILDDLSAEEAARLGLALGDRGDGGKPNIDKKGTAEKPNFTTSVAAVKATSAAKTQKQHIGVKSFGKSIDPATNDSRRAKSSWLWSLFSDSSSESKESRRPPSSGSVGWVMQEDFEDDADDVAYGKPARQAISSTVSSSKSTKTPSRSSGDGFVIGVQDWRDPDLVAEQKERLTASASSRSSTRRTSTSVAPTLTGLKGGSITPGSGEYGKPSHEAVDLLSWSRSSSRAASKTQIEERHTGSRSWLRRLFGSWNDEQDNESSSRKSRITSSTPVSPPLRGTASSFEQPDTVLEHHEGLWVTLTPTSVSSSPFFDTLLVLVVSPLVTLTVVYALLLLRSRIRRRRWRAPKSIVERLPVRTYQTMPSTTNSSSTTSSVSSPVNAATPLLPSATRPISTRPRPRARTASEVPVQPSSSLRSDETASPSLDQIEEKRATGLAEWRKRYVGKQRECVVCLEEYVDGVSRVMSLPCGHEFHAECITPWLTTRRRTCPICKGDVVRSLARSATSTSPNTPAVAYHDSSEDEEDVQEQAAVSRNDDPASNQPISREEEAFEDLERGVSGDDRTR